ncbi:MAG: NUDIX domain-containing protein [Usitatibacter sp.]
MPRLRRATQSAGILLHRRRDGALEVLLVHPGGPYWKNKDAGAWSIPKGEVDPGEDPLAAAQREFAEETGIVAAGPFVALTPRRQKSGKTIHAWAAEGDADASAVKSNEFEMEWPPRSGKLASFPEVDRAAWFPLAEARAKIIAGQAPFLDELESLAADGGPRVS